MRILTLSIRTLFIALSLLCWACRQDVDELRPYPASQAELAQLLTQVPNAATQTTFLLGGLLPDTTLSTASGIRLHLTDPEALFAASGGGTPVPCSSCQQLKITLTEVTRKGDLLARKLPTVNADGAWLESIGAVRVEIYCDGQKLDLLPGRNLKIQIPALSTEADFQVFRAEMSGADVQYWNNTNQPVYQAEWPIGNNQTQKGYEILATQTGWISGQKLLSTPTSSDFCVELGGQFAAENTQVYVVLKNDASVIALPALPDPAERRYCLSGAPEGYLVRIVTISKVGEQYWLGYMET